MEKRYLEGDRSEEVDYMILKELKKAIDQKGDRWEVL